MPTLKEIWNYKSAKIAAGGLGLALLAYGAGEFMQWDYKRFRDANNREPIVQYSQMLEIAGASVFAAGKALDYYCEMSTEPVVTLDCHYPSPAEAHRNLESALKELKGYSHSEKKQTASGFYFSISKLSEELSKTDGGKSESDYNPLKKRITDISGSIFDELSGLRRDYEVFEDVEEMKKSYNRGEGIKIGSVLIGVITILGAGILGVAEHGLMEFNRMKRTSGRNKLPVKLEDQ